MILSQVTGVVQIPIEQLNTAVLISVYLTFSIILFNVCKPFNYMRVILYGIMFGLAMICIVFMPMVNGFWNGNLNLFKLASITDITTIFMIMSLLLISIYTIKVCNYIADQFKLDEKGNKVTEKVTSKNGKEYLRVVREEVTEARQKDMPSRLNARRKMMKKINKVKDSEGKNIDLTSKLFNEIAPKYTDRVGGYTRIVKLGKRRGDAAEVVVLQLV